MHLPSSARINHNNIYSLRLRQAGIYKMKRFYFLTIVFLSICGLNCKKEVIPPPPEEIQPGRRDYVWAVDTLKLPRSHFFTPSRIWGSNPADVWITGFGDAGNLLWHFDGTVWTRDSTHYLINPSALWGTTSNNIWLGNSNSTFWRYDGTKWYKFSEHKLSGFDAITIVDIYGTSSNDLWAAGDASQFFGGTKYNGVMMHFDGSQWQFVSIPEIRVGFTTIFKQQSTGLYFLHGIQYETTGDTDRIYSFDGRSFNQVHATGQFGTNIFLVRDEVYFVMNRKIYKYFDNKMELWKDFTGTGFVGVMVGRSEKDFFTYNTTDFVTWNLGQYNGTDLQTIYTLPPNYQTFGVKVFEKDIFFQNYLSQSAPSIIVHGKLKE